MATTADLLAKCHELTNQRVTVPDNPYGGQCAAYVDYLTRFFTNKSLSYTNAINLLNRASANGFKVEYFNGGNTPQAGAFFVSACSNHIYGHTGVFLEGGSRPMTSEQNVDNNADALTNGGWVRQKRRLIYPDGTFAYEDGLPSQRLIGWFYLPLEQEAPKTETKKTVRDLRRFV